MEESSELHRISLISFSCISFGYFAWSPHFFLPSIGLQTAWDPLYISMKEFPRDPLYVNKRRPMQGFSCEKPRAAYTENQKS